MCKTTLEMSLAWAYIVSSMNTILGTCGIRCIGALIQGRGHVYCLLRPHTATVWYDQRDTSAYRAGDAARCKAHPFISADARIASPPGALWFRYGLSKGLGGPRQALAAPGRAQRREEPRGNLKREHRWRCCGLSRGSQRFKGVRLAELILLKVNLNSRYCPQNCCRRGLDS